MPLGYECRTRLLKQVPLKPTQRRGEANLGLTPGPNQYETPPVIGGNGYSNIKRAPAYTFGIKPKFRLKSITTPYAPVFNTRGLLRNGRYRITHSVVTPRIEPVGFKGKQPGPADYVPHSEVRYKRPPAYSMRPAPHSPRQDNETWSPSPNMYCPPINGRKPPAFTMGPKYRDRKIDDTKTPNLGPGEYSPNFDYAYKTKPAFSISREPRFFALRWTKSPPPTAYCEKRFLLTKPTAPAPSFGIRHSPYIGQQETYLKPSKLNISSA